MLHSPLASTSSTDSNATPLCSRTAATELPVCGRKGNVDGVDINWGTEENNVHTTTYTLYTLTSCWKSSCKIEFSSIPDVLSQEQRCMDMNSFVCNIFGFGYQPADIILTIVLFWLLQMGTCKRLQCHVLTIRPIPQTNFSSVSTSFTSTHDLWIEWIDTSLVI